MGEAKVCGGRWLEGGRVGMGLFGSSGWVGWVLAVGSVGRGIQVLL